MNLVNLFSKLYIFSSYTRCGRKVMKSIFLFTKVFIFFKHQWYPLQNSSIGQLHTDRELNVVYGIQELECWAWVGCGHFGEGVVLLCNDI